MHLKVVKVVNFILCIFYYNEKEKKTRAKRMSDFSRTTQWLAVPGEAPEDRCLLPLQVPGTLAQAVTFSPAEDPQQEQSRFFWASQLRLI